MLVSVFSESCNKFIQVIDVSGIRKSCSGSSSLFSGLKYRFSFLFYHLLERCEHLSSFLIIDWLK